MTLQPKHRNAIAALCLSAAGLVGLVVHEGYTDQAVIPVPGDVPTIGFGTTDGVKMGDRTTPPAALARAYREIGVYEGAAKNCVKVPLSQGEYDASIQLAYNIGAGAFCRSTVVKRFNAMDYEGACDAFLMWNKVGGREVRGLTKRRERERELCLGR
jgi:lysozyme